MKKAYGLLVAMLAVILAMVAVGVWYEYRAHTQPPAPQRVAAQNPPIEWNPFDEVEKLVVQTHRTHSIVTAPSAKLIDEINENPRKILVALVVAEAKRGWPGMSKNEAIDLISESRTNAISAVENLRVVLRRNADKAITDAGHNPKKENWDENNVATAILFCYWPRAEQKHKESRFLLEYISGMREQWSSWLFAENGSKTTPAVKVEGVPPVPSGPAATIIR